MFEPIFQQLLHDRQARGIRQWQVAVRAGLSRTTVSRGELGSLPTLPPLIEWAHALDWQLIAVTPVVMVPINSAPRVGHVLRDERRRRQLTQARLAPMTGFQAAEISRWEHGLRYPKLATLARWLVPLEVRFELRRRRRP